eukprot:GFUD01027630.1.p1 GENE.GFUD01027630.1~~GFUD01027630.1.p1  ORF type:complete len:330 (+),score=71.45 GFUD01027630.1:80-1069(+)
MSSITSLMLVLVPLIIPSFGQVGALPSGYGGEVTLGASPSGYGGEVTPTCHMVEKIVFKTSCEPYSEETCYTQNEEDCVMEDYKNCTGVIETKMERACFSVEEMLCSLEEQIHYETVQETYQVMHCFSSTDRVCDTVFNIDFLDKDDYQCLSVQTPNCYQDEQTINDITCTDTLEFDCNTKQLEDYSKQTVCARFPKKDCYQVPRKVLVEVCEQDVYEYCEKFTNTEPIPIENQNCHFEKKKICEIQKMSRPKKAKNYSYTKDCKKVDREICSQVERKKIEPLCDLQERLKCSYTPLTKCEMMDKLYCHKVEEVTMEEICDAKFETNYL